MIGRPQNSRELVKDLRRELQLTQGELARQLGLDQRTIARWESGVYAIPVRAENHLKMMHMLLFLTGRLDKVEDRVTKLERKANQ